MTTADHQAVRPAHRTAHATAQPADPGHRTGRGRRAARRAALGGALGAAVLLGAAGTASAHVTVHPNSYPRGTADGTLTFRVPNEEDTASTTEVDVYFPAGQPIPSVLVAPVPGWTAKVRSTTLKTPIRTDDGEITTAVSEIAWTGGRIAPGQYQDFTLTFGQLPDTGGSLVFKALQTYSDGDVVRWIDVPRQGQPEPEHPAPTLTLTSTAAARPAAADDSTARGLGIAGVVLGALGLAAGAAAWRRGRRGAS